MPFLNPKPQTRCLQCPELTSHFPDPCHSSLPFPQFPQVGPCLPHPCILLPLLHPSLLPHQLNGHAGSTNCPSALPLLLLFLRPPPLPLLLPPHLLSVRVCDSGHQPVEQVGVHGGALQHGAVPVWSAVRAAADAVQGEEEVML